jgi:predicted AAA+ superfamily ATPase
VIDQHLMRLLGTSNRWLQGAALQPWLKQRLPDRYLPRSLAIQAGDRAALVVGPRQTGKSTLIWKTVADLGRPVLFLSCEEPSIREWLRSPGLFLADIEEISPVTTALFFEEVQALDNAGLFLKGLVDLHSRRQIYATGSSSFDLEDAIRESLAGRARRHLLLPFSIGEIAATLESAQLPQLALDEAVERLLIYGGYPTVHLSPQPVAELAGLVEAFVIRDASDRFRIRYPAALHKILELAASQIGNLFVFSEWAAVAGISNDTVSEYCSLLEQTHVIKLVRPYVGGKRAEITSAPKVFFIDNGIRNQLFGGFQPWQQRADRGPLLENLVFSELHKSLNPLLDRIRYWRSKSGAEVDFVVEHQGRLLAIEAKVGDVRGKVSRSARSFTEAYQPEALLIVSQGQYPESELGSTRVCFVTVAQVSQLLKELGFSAGALAP